MSDIRVENQDGILLLTFDRPAKKNAITDAMYGVLADAMEAAEADPDVRVLLFAGEGDMFTAGNDLSDFAAANAGGAASGGPRHVARFLAALAGARKPLVAAVHGKAVGVGTTMLLHCDHVILAEGTELSVPFVSLALVPEAASSRLLVERIGHARAYAMFALGDSVKAEDAVQWGIANRAVPANVLRAAAMQVAERLAAQPLGALVATKALMRDSTAIATLIERESRVFAERLRTPEAAEAFTAFAERRKPDFRKFR